MWSVWVINSENEYFSYQRLSSCRAFLHFRLSASTSSLRVQDFLPLQLTLKIVLWCCCCCLRCDTVRASRCAAQRIREGQFPPFWRTHFSRIFVKKKKKKSHDKRLLTWDVCFVFSFCAAAQQTVNVFLHPLKCKLLLCQIDLHLFERIEIKNGVNVFHIQLGSPSTGLYRAKVLAPVYENSPKVFAC